MTGRILMATVAALALTVPAVAQEKVIPPDTAQEQGLQEEGATEGTMTEQAPAMAQEQPAEEEVMPPAEMAFLQVQEETQILASDELIGEAVHNVMDEEVGTIADLVLDEDHKLTGVVLSVGGFLGIGGKWVAVPLEQIELPSTDQPARLQVAVTAEQLTNAPDFITRETIEAQRAAEEAQRQALEQQQQIPAPTAGAQ